MATQYVTSLDASVPQITDPVADGAEEIRNLKETIKNSFPYANSPLNVSNEAIVDAIQSMTEMSNSIAALTARIEALENA
jgi:hypothetical protein